MGSSLLSFLSPALTTGANAASAYQGAHAQVANRQREEGIQQMLLQAQLLKQQHEQQIMDALHQAQTTKALRVPYHPIDPNSKEGIAAAIQKQPPGPPVVVGNGENKWTYARPAQAIGGTAPPPAASEPTIQVLPGSEGKPPQGVVTHGPGLGSTIAIPDVDKSGGKGGTIQQKASLEAGLRTLTQADQDATKYEEGVLQKIRAGKRGGPNVLAAQAGAFANPSTHPDASPLASGLLNFTDPDYANYTKSLTAAANAGMLIAQRPSDVRMKKEEYLAGVSMNPTESLIQQARQWRADMKASFQSQLGNLKPATLPSGGAKAPASSSTLTVTPQERAQLKAMGYTDAQITARYGTP